MKRCGHPPPDLPQGGDLRDDFFDRLREPCPVAKGARIKFLSHGEHDPDPLASGEMGTVTGGNGSQVHVKWDSGRTLSLVVGSDRFVVVSDDAT